MTMSTRSTEDTPSNQAAEIRGTLAHLEALDTQNDGYLSALAFILQRVAAADENISNEEIYRMEKILVDHASLSPAEAVLTVEIAKQRGRIADCCCSYTASRHMRSLLDSEGQAQMRSFLISVAKADGLVRRSEKAEIHQITTELGLN